MPLENFMGVAIIALITGRPARVKLVHAATSVTEWADDLGLLPTLLGSVIPMADPGIQVCIFTE